MSDYYATPAWAIREFLDAFQADYSIPSLAGLAILDPCAGGDSERPCAYPEVLKERGADRVHSLDLREDSPAIETGVDFCALSPDEALFSDCDLVITNPPFALALPIIEKALEFTRFGGHVVMLLRLNFFGTQDRFPFFRRHMPSRCYVHHKRIPFNGAKRTDSIEYAHFVWTKGERPETTQLRVI